MCSWGAPVTSVPPLPSDPLQAVGVAGVMKICGSLLASCERTWTASRDFGPTLHQVCLSQLLTDLTRASYPNGSFTGREEEVLRQS